MIKSGGNFCAACGSIMQPPLEVSAAQFIECVVCKAKWPYHISHGQLLNRYERNYERAAEQSATGELREDEDVTVAHQCPKCEHGIATYTTQQTRSADEGQTVFFQCVRCKHRCIEYS